MKKNKNENENISNIYNEYTILNKFINKFKNEYENKLNNYSTSPVVEFKSGFILKSFLGKKPIILKNLSNIPTVRIERFNELFEGLESIVLNEDIHNTFTSSENKSIKLKKGDFKIIATCHNKYVRKLSEAIKSRFSMIYIDKYNENEIKIILNKKIKEKKINIDEENLNKILDIVKKSKIILEKEFSLNELISFIKIINKMPEEFNMKKKN